MIIDLDAGGVRFALHQGPGAGPLVTLLTTPEVFDKPRDGGRYNGRCCWSRLKRTNDGVTSTEPFPGSARWRRWPNSGLKVSTGWLQAVLFDKGRHHEAQRNQAGVPWLKPGILALPQPGGFRQSRQASGSSGKCLCVRAGRDRSGRDHRLASQDAQPDRHGTAFAQGVLAGLEALNRSGNPLRQHRPRLLATTSLRPDHQRGPPLLLLSIAGVVLGVISNRSDPWHQALPSGPMPEKHIRGTAGAPDSPAGQNPIPWPSHSTSAPNWALTLGPLAR